MNSKRTRITCSEFLGSGRAAGEWRAGLLLQRRLVDHEAVFHIALEEPISGRIDLADADHFDRVESSPQFSREFKRLFGSAVEATEGIKQMPAATP